MIDKELDKVLHQREAKSKELRKKFFNYLLNDFDFIFPINLKDILNILNIGLIEYNGVSNIKSLYDDISSNKMLSHSLDAFAYSFWGNNNYPIVAINNNLILADKNFIIAHELFHILSYNKNKYSPPFIDKEIYLREDKFADNFSLHLITPQNLFNLLSIANNLVLIKNYFQIPLFKLIIHFFRLREIKTLDLYLLVEDDIAQHYFKREQEPIIKETSILSQSLLTDQFKDKRNVTAIYISDDKTIIFKVDRQREKRMLQNIPFFNNFDKGKNQHHAFIFTPKPKILELSGSFFGVSHNFNESILLGKTSIPFTIFYFLPDKDNVLFKLWENNLFCLYEPQNYNDFRLLLDLKIDDNINDKLNSIYGMNDLKKEWINQGLKMAFYKYMDDF